MTNPAGLSSSIRVRRTRIAVIASWRRGSKSCLASSRRARRRDWRLGADGHRHAAERRAVQRDQRRGQNAHRHGRSARGSDRRSGPRIDRTRDEIVRQYFNTRAFVTRALGTFGNTGRNSLVGPASANVDISLHRNLPITSAVRLQFRAEAFNVFNRVGGDNPNSDRSSANFGRMLTAKLPRILQFALRASFWGVTV